MGRGTAAPVPPAAHAQQHSRLRRQKHAPQRRTCLRRRPGAPWAPGARPWSPAAWPLAAPPPQGCAPQAAPGACGGSTHPRRRRCWAGRPGRRARRGPAQCARGAAGFCMHGVCSTRGGPEVVQGVRKGECQLRMLHE